MASTTTTNLVDQCAICHNPLLVPTRDDPNSPSMIIDDVKLRCGHHFHWSCIMEYAASSPSARERCALCRANVLNSNGKFVVTVRNEGGFIGGFNLGDEIDREAFLDANPETRRIETFLSLMSQMEFDDAETFLKGEDEGANGVRLSPDVAYSSGNMTAMHMAALNDDVEGVELLLKYGADKEFKAEGGQTALDMAREQEAEGVIALLSR